MQLNDILEKNSVKEISQQTQISTDNLENLFDKNFGTLKRVKTLGFISIIEREYNADLGDFAKEAKEYYADKGGVQDAIFQHPTLEEEKGKSKLFMFIILILLGYATWYFITQFDKTNLSKIIPFVDNSTIESFTKKKKTEDNSVKELSIAKVSMNVTKVKQDTKVATQSKVLPKKVITEKDTNITIQKPKDISAKAIAKKTINIVPVKHLWFGLVDMKTKQREYFTISKSYELNVSSKKWLVATSSAAFSFKDGNSTKKFNDAKEHYFKIDENGIKVLTKSDYVTLGGWSQW